MLSILTKQRTGAKIEDRLMQDGRKQAAEREERQRLAEETFVSQACPRISQMSRCLSSSRENVGVVQRLQNYSRLYQSRLVERTNELRQQVRSER